MRQRVGRHLVEFLVVGVIICAIGAVVLAVNLRAGGKARELRCASHAHQLALALQQYCDDHDGRLPLGPEWQSSMLAYAEQSEDPSLTVFTCPQRGNAPGFAFGLNYDLAGEHGDAVAQHVWLAEVHNGSGEVWWANDLRFRRLEHNRTPMAAHRHKATFCRGDGSVRALEPAGLIETDWLPAKQ